MDTTTGPDWADFEAGDAALAAFGRGCFYRSGDGLGLLATVRGDGLPRIHPINLEIVDGRLLAFLHHSPKAADLAADGRYAIQAHQDPLVPHEFGVRGRGRAIDDPAIRAAAVAVWPFAVDDSYLLYAFSIEHAIAGRRDTAASWPPIITSWRPSA